MQLTDTDFSADFKRDLEGAKEQERKRCSTMSRMAGVKPKFLCGALEILTIVHEAQQAQMKRQEEKPWVLEGCRRNGWLCWRPNLAKGCLEECSKQEWAADKPQGSTRLPWKWLKERACGLDSAGKPVLPDLQKDMEAAEALAAEAEAEFCSAEGYLLDSHCTLEFDEMKEGMQRELANCEDWLPPRALRALKGVSQAEMACRIDAISMQAKKQQQRKAAVKKAKNHEFVLSAKGVESLHKSLQHTTVQAAMQSIVPAAGKSKRKLHAKAKPKAKAKSAAATAASPAATVCEKFALYDTVLVVDERALEQLYGAVGQVRVQSVALVEVNFPTCGGQAELPMEYLELQAKFEPPRALQSMQQLRKPPKEATLAAMQCAGEGGDQVEVPAGGAWMLFQSIRAGWELMKLTLLAKPGTMETVQLVDPEGLDVIWRTQADLEKGDVQDAEAMVEWLLDRWLVGGSAWMGGWLEVQWVPCFKSALFFFQNPSGGNPQKKHSGGYPKNSSGGYP